jgi:hypothetical protein
VVPLSARLECELQRLAESGLVQYEPRQVSSTTLTKNTVGWPGQCSARDCLPCLAVCSLGVTPCTTIP